jgi:hypothetical protein
MDDDATLIRRLLQLAGDDAGEIPDDDIERDCRLAARRLFELREERVDWARRFKLNDVTPWDWMTRATAAEARAEMLRDLLRMIVAHRTGATRMSDREWTQVIAATLPAPTP